MPSVNPGPASSAQVNTQTPAAFEQFIQTIAVNLTPLSVATITSAEQSFGANGVSQVTAATGIKAGDVIMGFQHARYARPVSSRRTCASTLRSTTSSTSSS
jgi:hypothetical protein